MKARTKVLNDIESFKSALKDNNLKATPQRMAVHAAMLEMGHASADMVCAFIKSTGQTKISPASVYNILSELADCGIYKLRHSGTNKMFFDVNNSKHLHLYNNQLNEFTDLVDDELIEYLETRFKKRKFKGLKIDSIDVQLICHSTKRKEK